MSVDSALLVRSGQRVVVCVCLYAGASRVFMSYPPSPSTQRGAPATATSAGLLARPPGTGPRIATSPIICWRRRRRKRGAALSTQHRGWCVCVVVWHTWWNKATTTAATKMLTVVVVTQLPAMVPACCSWFVELLWKLVLCNWINGLTKIQITTLTS